MKRIISLLLVIALLLTGIAALAEGNVIDSATERNISIQPAGDNEIPEGVSPTTGRNLAEVRETVPETSLGMAVTGRYLPVMVQIVNNKDATGAFAPLNAASADIVYQTMLYSDGRDRMTMIFCDVIPDYIGYVRSTRLTHLKIRQEWDCPYVTSGFAPSALERLSAYGLTQKSPILFVGDYLDTNKIVGRIKGKQGVTVPGGASNEVFHLKGVVEDMVSEDCLPRTHAFRFTDEKPQGGDEATFIYVNLANGSDADMFNSRLEYDEETNTYTRYLTRGNKPVAYADNHPDNLTIVRNEMDREKWDYLVDALIPGEEFEFSNVIVQFVDYNWISFEAPDPILVGTGNADYFMGGRHLAGVWQRIDDNSRTVFYGENGEEIELQRGKTLIILADTSRGEEHYISFE